ncbi:hypothetical protein DSO57_1012910 [Entomophthora muscae]|uniref:Uncharacterized protein n=1 Tax=Entomophthora muscae TaxID=34485 RepID=A0ACC2SJA6_9FUNG|nr:hypothetical protein DSO57_1012910 [Entomophthora muscae]
MTLPTSYCTSLSQLSHYLNEAVESFENWSKIKDTIVSLKALFTSSAATHASFPTDVAAIAAPLVKYINSDRTSLAKEAIDLSAHLSRRLKTGFTAHVNQFCPALIQTLGKTNNIYRSQGFAALSTIIANVKSVVVVRQICSAAVCKSIIARPLSANLFQELISSFSAQLLLQGHTDIEKVFSKGLSDPVLDIKEVFRSAFQIYIDKLPSRLDPLTKSLPKEVLKFYDQSRAVPSAQIIQVATQSVKPASKIPSSAQPIKKSLPIQVDYASSSSNMASSISSVSKHQTKPSAAQLSKNLMQASSMPSSSAAVHSASSASKLQIKRGTIFNEKIPDYSHVKSKVCQGRAASAKALPTSQKPNVVKSSSIPSKRTQSSLRTTVFSQSSRYVMATTKKVPSSQKVTSYSHTLRSSQKPDEAVSQKVPNSQNVASYSHTLHSSQKPVEAVSQKVPRSQNVASYSHTLHLSQKPVEAVSQKVPSSQNVASYSHTIYPSQKPDGVVSQKISSSKEYEPYSQSLLSQKPNGVVSQKISSSSGYRPYSQLLMSQKHESHESTSHIASNQKANTNHYIPSQRIERSYPPIITAALPKEGMSNNTIQVPQSAHDAIQISKSKLAAISQSPKAPAVPSPSASKRPPPFTIEEKDIKHRKLGPLLDPSGGSNFSTGARCNYCGRIGSYEGLY